jgi:peptidoglycan/xylan/chitin deacetylase (PgdA/CDA1 family)
VTTAALTTSLVAASAAVTLTVAESGPHYISGTGAAWLQTSPQATTMPGIRVLQVRAHSQPGNTPRVSVPILLYHYIRIDTNPADRLGIGLSTPPAVFKAEMDWLRNVGGHTVTLAQVMAALEGGPRLPPRPVVLTFDDGHESFATEALPVLLADGFVATVFVNTGLMGRPSYMSSTQVKQVAADGMVIGDHTVDHVDLNALPEVAARSEIDVDRSLLQSLTGQRVLDFAYPYGDYDAQVVSLVAALGFRDAVTTNYGRTELLSAPFTMPRNRCGGGDNVWSFAAKAGIPLPPAHWSDPSNVVAASQATAVAP